MRTALLLLALTVIACLSLALNAFGWVERVRVDYLHDSDLPAAVGWGVVAGVVALLGAVEVIAVFGLEQVEEAVRTEGARWKPILGFPLFVLCVLVCLYSGHQALDVLFDLDAGETRRDVVSLEDESERLSGEARALAALDINSTDPDQVEIVQRELNRLRPELSLAVDGIAGTGVSTAYGAIERELAEADKANRETLEETREHLAKQEEDARIAWVFLAILEGLKCFGRAGFVIAKRPARSKPAPPSGEAQDPQEPALVHDEASGEYFSDGRLVPVEELVGATWPLTADKPGPEPSPDFTWSKVPTKTGTRWKLKRKATGRPRKALGSGAHLSVVK